MVLLLINLFNIDLLNYLCNKLNGFPLFIIFLEFLLILEDIYYYCNLKYI